MLRIEDHSGLVAMVMWVQTIHMQWFVYLTLSLSSALPEMVVAQTLRLPNPLPAGGETFVDPVYDSHDASRLYITHKTGVASVRIARLPDTLQQKLGYSANNAQVAESAFAKRQAEAEAQQAIEFDSYLKQLKAAERKREEAFRKAAPTYAVTFTRSKTPQSYSSPPSSPPRKLSYKEKQAQARLEYYQGMNGTMESPAIMASREEREAYTAQEVNRGNLPLSELPEAYGGRPKARAPSDKRPSSETVSGFDHSGNFYHGSLGPSGTFSGFRQGPSGAAIINNNFDQNGGFVSPY